MHFEELLPRFSVADFDRANDEWGANCGPGAIAVIMGMTLDEVRPHLGDFEGKRYTNPTLMFETLSRIGRLWQTGKGWPNCGLARVQWEGPWTEPGVPVRARYRHTHWVATAPSLNGGRYVYDINAMYDDGERWCSGWVRGELWVTDVVPFILSACVPRASGQFHITHGIEVGNGR